MTKFCVFDLDGTLLNTLGNIGGNMNRALEDFGIEPFPLEQYRYFVGNGSRNLTERALAARGKLTPEFFEEFYPHFFAIYEAVPDRGVTVYDEIETLLSALKERGIRLAVCTNKPNAAAQKSVAGFFDEGTFDDVIGAVDGMALKPAPDGAIEVLKQLGVTPEESIYVGDTWVDMQTGKSLGAFTIGVLWGFREYDELKSNGADLIVEKPSEIMDYIKKVNG